MDQVIIKDLQVRTVIGIDEHERSHLSDVLINLVIFTDFSQAGQSDDINDCINYSTIIKQVQALVEKVARHTVEALAEDIARFCLEIPGVSGVKVRVEKPNAVYFTRLVGVEIERFAVSILQTRQGVEEEISTKKTASANLSPEREWKIRPAVAADIPELVELRLGMFESMGYTDPADLDRLRKQSVEYMSQKIPTGEYMSWVADVNGHAVASAGLVIRSAPPTVHNQRGLEGYVISVFTAPEWRKQGMARGIMNAIIDYLREKGIMGVTLRATEQGRPLYLSLGFTSDDRTMAMDIK